MRRNSGQTMMTIIAGVAAVTALTYVVTGRIKGNLSAQANLRTASIASGLETRFRAATLSSASLAKTRAANTALAQCVSATNPHCPPVGSAPQSIQLETASGATLIPKPSSATAPVYVNDAGVGCTPGADATCRWLVSAKFTPKDAAGKVVTLIVTVGLDTAAKKGEPMTAAKEIRMDVPQALFTSPNYAGCGQCNVSTEVMSGLKPDGCPLCVPNPLLAYFQNYPCGTTQAAHGLNFPTMTNSCLDLAAAAPPSGGPPATPPPATVIPPATSTPPASTPPAAPCGMYKHGIFIPGVCCPMKSYVCKNGESIGLSEVQHCHPEKVCNDGSPAMPVY